jgi:hypothetical protein
MRGLPAPVTSGILRREDLPTELHDVGKNIVSIMSEMTSRERIMTTIRHQEPDRVPLYTFGLDPKFAKAFGGGDPLRALDFLKLDCFPMRLQQWCQGVPILASLSMDIAEEDQTSGGTYAGWNGIDEFGRVWKRGSYVGGALKSWDDLERYIPPLDLEKRIPLDSIRECKARYPGKAFALSTHLGPFGLSMESMGFEHFLYSLEMRPSPN